ncbi:MAG: hypothetical protein K6G10_06750 [Butyrivibrio sp.]|nr:hypothetical protein [Butyrivibrio sp.]
MEKNDNIFSKIINKTDKLIKKPYYYVGNCPHCGSPITGRYVKMHRKTDAEWQIDEALKNGELVRVRTELIGSNCFCLSCDSDFAYPVQFKLLSIEDIKGEKLKRHTAEILTERMQDEYHQKHKGFLSPFINFVGKI